MSEKMHLYKSNRTIISATRPIEAVEVWEKESSESYPGRPEDWVRLPGRLAFIFAKSELVPIPNTARVMDEDGFVLARDDADNWAAFWPNRTVSFEE